jgi:hypothetical protein
MPATPDQEWTYWDGQLTSLERTQLATVQQAATGWRTLFGALLGVFTAVAFAGGVTTIDKLSNGWGDLVKGVTLLAVVGAAIATYLSNKASQSTSVSTIRNLTAEGLQQSNAEQARSSLARLRLAKIAGASAVVAVLVGSSLVLVVGPSSPTPTQTDVLLITHGDSVCGPVASSNGQLSVDGIPITERFDRIIVVSSCP